MLYRLVLSDKLADGLITIQTEWTVFDVLETSIALDIVEDAAILRDQRMTAARPPRRAR